MPRHVNHEMSINDIVSKLQELIKIVPDEYVKVVEEAKRYVDECRGMNDEQ